MKRFGLVLLTALSVAVTTSAQEVLTVQPMPATQTVPNSQTAPGEYLVPYNPQSQPVPQTAPGEFLTPYNSENGSNGVPWAMPEEASSRGLWLRTESLLWWIKDGPNANPLVTSGSAADARPGALGQPGTRVLFGGEDFDYDTFSGLRVSGGTTLCEGNLGVEMSGFITEQRSEGFRAGSDNGGSPLLARPVIDASGLARFVGQGQQTEAFAFISFPATFSGTLDIRTTSQLWGLEANASATLYSGGSLSASFLAGARFIELEEDLTFQQRSTALSNRVFFGVAGFRDAGFSAVISDRFIAENRFYGGQLGARAEYKFCNLNVEVLGKLGLGTTRRELRVNGLTQLFAANGANVATAAGGILALPSNSGTFEDDKFTVLPEVNVNVSYQFAQWARLTAGYTFLYWDNVYRPGDQIDRGVNFSQVPAADPGPFQGNNRPLPLLHENHIWAQGVNFGLDFRY